MLAGLALRLAAVEALCPTAALLGEEGVRFPTIAGPRVADSRIVPRDDRDPETALPFIAVYVEDVDGRPFGEATPTHPLTGTFDLVCELDVRILDRALGDEPGAPGDELLPKTDPVAEAMLDLMSAQVLYALEVDMRPGGALFRSLRRRVTRVETVPLRDASLGVRFARRTMRIGIEMDGDDWDGFSAGGLPAPLALLAEELPAESYGAAVIGQVRDALLDPAALDGLTTIMALHHASGGGLRTTADGDLRATADDEARGMPGDRFASDPLG